MSLKHWINRGITQRLPGQLSQYLSEQPSHLWGAEVDLKGMQGRF